MTTTARTNAARSLLISLMGSEVGPAEHRWAELVALLDRHPNAAEKRGCGVVAFIVEPSPVNGAPVLFVRRADGTTVDVSWIKCARAADGPPGLRLRKAMRRAVLDQTLAVRNAALARAELCAICRSPLVRGAVHIDHVVPFEALVTAFLSVSGPAPLRFGDDAVSHTATFLESDHEFARRWEDYHRTHAELRATCDTCNLTRRI